MRWDNLFDDLESQLEQELSAEEVDLRAEEERLRISRLGIRDRLHALHVGAAGDQTRTLQLVLRDDRRVAVLPTTFGRDWLSGGIVDETGRRPACVVPIDAIDGVVLARRQVEVSFDAAAPVESTSALSGRLGMPFVLRDLCRRRHPVELWLDGAVTDAAKSIRGTIDRVGRDHLDLAIHEVGVPRRESAVTEYRMIRLSRVLLVRL